MKTIEGKKPAPNGFWIGNITLSDKKGKLVMVQPIKHSHFDYIVLSNSTRAKQDPTFKPMEGKEGWVFKNIKKSEITIYQFSKTK